MNTKMLLVVVALVAFVIGIGVGIFAAPFILFHGGGPGGGHFVPHSTVNMSGTLLSSSQYAQYAYQISGNATLSSSGQIATSDFNLTKNQLQNGSTTYTMAFSESGKVYNVTIGSTDKLYYIDSNLADDARGSDISLGDDGYAVVNSTGYIVTIEYPLPDT